MIIKLNNFELEIPQVANLRKKLINSSSFECSSDKSFVTAFVMPEGSGKTTLAQCFAGISSNFKGEFNFIGLKEVSKIFPLITGKDNTLPWLSVKKNVALGCKRNSAADSDRLQKALELTGLDGYEDHFPEDTSYGFRFRMALARSICTGTDLILLDDPFRFMDDESSVECMQLVREVSTANGINFIAILQSAFEAAQIADYIVHYEKSTKTFTDTINTADSNAAEKLQSYYGKFSTK